MRVVDKYRQKMDALKRLQEELSALEKSEELQGELQFSKAVEDLLVEYQISRADAITILTGEAPESSRPKKRRTRRSFVVKNPHTGETVTASTRANRIVKAWIKQYGESVVKSWTQDAI